MKRNSIIPLRKKKILGVFDLISWKENLKLTSRKLDNNECMMTLTQITNTEIFAFIAFLVFELLTCKSLFIKRKDIRNW